MAPDKLSRDPSQGGDEPAEGVRIIAAEELEEVAERSEVARRRSPDEPGYKDRPPAPPADVRPAIRFPLPDSADPSAIERPRPAPVEAPRAEGSVPDRPRPETTPVSLGEEPGAGARPAPQPAAAAEEPSTGRLAAAEPPAAAPPDGPGGCSDVRAHHRPDRREDAGPPPVLDFGPTTGEHQLPHWTEPATGEVPKVVIGDAEVDPEDEERWASFAANGPRWRDEHDTSEHGDLMADLAATGRRARQRAPRCPRHDRAPHRRGLPELRRRRARPPPARPSGLSPRSVVALEGGHPAAGRRPARRHRRRLRPGPPVGRPAPRQGTWRPDRAGTGRVDRARRPGRSPAPSARQPAAARSRARPCRASSAPPSTHDARASGRQRSRGGGRNVPQAIAVGVALAVVALLVFKAGPAPAMVLVEIVVALAGFEFYGAVLRGGFRPATLLGLTAVAALPLAAYWKGEAAFPMILFLDVRRRGALVPPRRRRATSGPPPTSASPWSVWSGWASSARSPP